MFRRWMQALLLALGLSACRDPAAAQAKDGPVQGAAWEAKDGWRSLLTAWCGAADDPWAGTFMKEAERLRVASMQFLDKDAEERFYQGLARDRVRFWKLLAARVPAADLPRLERFLLETDLYSGSLEFLKALETPCAIAVGKDVIFAEAQAGLREASGKKR